MNIEQVNHMFALGSLVVFMLQTFSHCGWEGLDDEHYAIIETCHKFLLDDNQPLCVISNCQQIAGQLEGAPKSHGYQTTWARNSIKPVDSVCIGFCAQINVYEPNTVHIHKRPIPHLLDKNFVFDQKVHH